MIVEVGENTYGWGPDVAPLPTDPMAAGPKVIDADESRALEDEIERHGWKAAGEDGFEVFLVAPKAWKRPVQFDWDADIKIMVAENPEGEQPPVGERYTGDPADFDTPPEGTPQQPPDEPKDAGEDA